MMIEEMYTAPDVPIEELRQRLEAVAENFGEDDWGWCWDETRMHLTVSDSQGNPVATLHVELTQ